MMTLTTTSGKTDIVGATKPRDGQPSAAADAERSAGLNPNLIHGALSQTAHSGVGRYYLANAKADGRFPKVPPPNSEKFPEQKPKIPGSTPQSFLEQYLAARAESEGGDLLRRARASLTNDVRICPQCGKVCGTTMKSCNSCSAGLEGVPISQTDNLLSCFCLGIERGRFPLKIGVRYESDRVLVFDDILALTPAHFLAVPTFAWISDWRWLLYHPAEGLALLKELRRCGEEVLREQFWDHADFRRKYWWRVEALWARECAAGGETRREGAADLPETEARDQSAEKMFGWFCENHVVWGLNYPPSQWHFHLQIAASPWLPFHQDQMQVGKHMHWGRFFTYSYVAQALEAMVALELRGQSLVGDLPGLDEKDIGVFVGWISEQLGVRYEECHRRAMDRAMRSQQELAAFDLADFESLVLVGPRVDASAGSRGEESRKVVLNAATWEKAVAGATAGGSADDPGEIQKRDTAVLMNYGAGGAAEGERRLGWYTKGLGTVGAGRAQEFWERNWWEAV